MHNIAESSGIDRAVIGHSISVHGESDGRRAEEGVEDGVEEWHAVRHHQRTQVPCLTCSKAGGENQESRDVSVEDHSQVLTNDTRYTRMQITLSAWHICMV